MDTWKIKSNTIAAVFAFFRLVSRIILDKGEQDASEQIPSEEPTRKACRSCRTCNGYALELESRVR